LAQRDLSGIASLGVDEVRRQRGHKALETALDHHLGRRAEPRLTHKSRRGGGK